MIQPINGFSTNSSYKKNSINFKNAAVQTASAKESANLNISEKRDMAIINFIEKTEKTQKQSQMLGVISLAAIIPLCFLPLIATKKKGGNFVGADNTKIFKSLKDDATVPTLDTCKSINEKLRNFLQTQVDFAKANPEDIAATGVKNPANRLILYGSPGSGKSFFAKIFAKTLDANYKEVQYADFNSKWAGEGTANMKKTFENVLDEAKKEPKKKFVLTFNEIDTLVQPAEAMQSSYARGGGSHNVSKLEERSTFLNYLDRLGEEAPNVTIIGTTNISPQNKGLDGAAMSRFKNLMEVSYPDKTCLLEALKANIRGLGDGEKFIESNQNTLETFAQSMVDRKSSFRDLNNVFENSKTYYLNDYMKDKNSKYKLDYLKQAFDSISLTDGEIAGQVKS